MPQEQWDMNFGSMVRGLALSCLFFTGACAWTEETVQIPRPAIAALSVPAAQTVTVRVETTDARPEREVSHKKNGYGMRGANILAANNFARDMEISLTEVLRQRGFVPGGDATVRLILNRFYNTFEMHFFSATATAQVIATLNVADRDGRAIYSRVYTAGHQEPGIQIMSADNAAAALSNAYRDLMQQIATDDQLLRAIIDAGRVSGFSASRLGS